MVVTLNKPGKATYMSQIVTSDVLGVETQKDPGRRDANTSLADSSVLVNFNFVQ